MSHPNVSPNPEASVVAWLNANVSLLASQITESQFVDRPELDQIYGSKGRAKCQEDTAYHLHYLASAIGAASPQLFAHYIGWAKIMLKSRGIEAEDLAQNLRHIKDALLHQCCDAEAALIREYIDGALQQLPQLPETVPSYIDARHPHSGLANEYLQHLLLFDRTRAIHAVTKAVEKGLSVKDVFQYVITPAQQEIGRLWQLNQITVIQEHYCSISADLLLMRLARRFIGVPREVSALTLCAENEEHCLGIKLLSELLESDGWKVHYVGAKSPTRDIIRHLKNNPTDLMAISIGTPMSLPRAHELIQAVRRLEPGTRPRILIGGAALNNQPDVVVTLGADGYAPSLLDGLEEANRIIRKAS